MQVENILQELNLIFRDILDNDKISLSRTTTADDLEEWDSLTHIQLVVAIEKKFKIKFTAAEIQGWKNVGEMCDTLQNKLSPKT